MESTRVCRSCRGEFPLERFPFAGSANKSNGLTYRRYKCQTCYQAGKRSRVWSIREWFAGYKKTRYCESCGIRDFRVLEFHHTGNKDFNVADAVGCGASKEKILAEVAKCQCLCANCHRIAHFEENLSE